MKRFTVKKDKGRSRAGHHAIGTDCSKIVCRHGSLGHGIALAGVAAWALVSSAWGQRALTEIPNPDPLYQQSMLEPAEGFEISLFASDPMIDKPLAISFDAKGRLWVACSETYPQIKPGERPSDKVYRIEDTDGDGRADRRTVFAEGLLLPTAILATPEGVYVGNSTELLFFEDKDDDGVADSKRTLLSGFGTEDTHHIVHTLRAGPAGRIYFNQSIYIHSYLETPRGIRELKAGGVWRLRPESMELDVYTRGLVNSWGHQFDQWGQSFQSDGAGSEGINYGFPGAGFIRSEGYDRILTGLNPGQPKHCGLEIISGGLFPEEWQGRIIVCDFRGNRINAFEVSDSGSSYLSLKREDLVSSSHGAFRPIDVQMGPDGALYVADWYNPIIQHGEVDFRDQRRDHTHGRIWRIAAKGSVPQKTPRLASASIPQLLDFLKSPEGWTRSQAKLLLKQKGRKTVIPQLRKWVDKLDTSDPLLDQRRLEALWVSQAVDQVDVDLATTLFESKDFHARAAAIRVLEERPSSDKRVAKLLQRAVQDPHPRVRLEALHSLRALGGAESARQAMDVYEESMDETLEFGLWVTMRELESEWLPQAEKDPGFFGSEIRKLFYAIRSINQPHALSPLVKLWRAGGLASDRLAEGLILMGDLGDASILEGVFAEAVRMGATGQSGAAAVLDALQRSSTRRKLTPKVDASQVAKLLKSKDDAVRVAMARLAGSWAVEEATSLLEALVVDGDSAPALADAAVEGLALMRSNEAKKALARLAGPEQPFATRLRAAAGYARSSIAAAAPMVVSVLTDAQPGDDARPLFRPYLAQTRSASVLADALEGAKMNPEVATAVLRLFGSVPVDTKKLQAAVQNAAGIKPINQALNPDQMASFIEYVHENGDPAQGEAVYRRESLLCSTCHAIGGAGGSLGPDMSSLGASAPMDYIVDSLLEPQKKVKEGYHVVMVTKKDGAAVAGMPVREDAQSLTLRDMSDRNLVVSKSDIASQTISPVSLMPPGLTASLRKDELADLVAFLSQLGKEGTYKVSPQRMVRTFEAMDDKDGDNALADIMRHKPMSHATTDDERLPWVRRYSRVDGTLPLDEIDVMRRAGRLWYHYIRFKLDVKTGGAAALEFNDPEGVQVWVGGNEVENVGKRARIELEPGVQRITVAVWRDVRKNKDLSVELVDVPGSSAQVQVINGK